MKDFFIFHSLWDIIEEDYPKHAEGTSTTQQRRFQDKLKKDATAIKVGLDLAASDRYRKRLCAADILWRRKASDVDIAGASATGGGRGRSVQVFLGWCSKTPRRREEPVAESGLIEDSD